MTTTPKRMDADALALVDRWLESAEQQERYGPGPKVGSRWVDDLRGHILALEQELAAAESRGYERARKQAAKVAQGAAVEWFNAGQLAMCNEMGRVATSIRAMTDERGEGTMCCRRCGEPIEKGPHGTWRHPAQTDDGHIALP